MNFTTTKTVSHVPGAWPKTPWELKVKVTKEDGSSYTVFNRFRTEAELKHWLKWA